MKAPNLIASIAAVLFTTATLGIIRHHIDHIVATAGYNHDSHLLEAAPTHVQASNTDHHVAALLTNVSNLGKATLPALSRINEAAPLSMLGSQLAMPYYSFGSKFGRLSSKE